MIALLMACGETPVCPEGEVRDGSSCVVYTPDAPVPSTGTAFPNGITWQWQLTGPIDRSIDVDVYDIDLFDATDADLQGLRDDGRRIVCYFSAGSYEAWRPDASAFDDDDIGRKLDGWPDERWVDPTSPSVRAIMEARLDLAVERGCDAVEPDNVTAHHETSGFAVNATEQLDYNRFLADAAHERGLSVALKNDVDQIEALVDWFDFAVNEECAFYDECQTNAPFVDAGRAVLHAEYVDRWQDSARRLDEVCGVEPGLSTIVKTWDLGPEFAICP
jgi:hypothetical protein